MRLVCNICVRGCLFSALTSSESVSQRAVTINNIHQCKDNFCVSDKIILNNTEPEVNSWLIGTLISFRMLVLASVKAVMSLGCLR